MSAPVFEHVDPELKSYGKPIQEDLEGLGSVETHYIDFSEIARERPEMVERTFFQKFVAWFKLTLRGFDPACVGPKQRFNVRMAPGQGRATIPMDLRYVAPEQAGGGCAPDAAR